MALLGEPGGKPCTFYQVSAKNPVVSRDPFEVYSLITWIALITVISCSLSQLPASSAQGIWIRMLQLLSARSWKMRAATGLTPRAVSSSHAFCEGMCSVLKQSFYQIHPRKSKMNLACGQTCLGQLSKPHTDTVLRAGPMQLVCSILGGKASKSSDHSALHLQTYLSSTVCMSYLPCYVQSLNTGYLTRHPLSWSWLPCCCPV